MNVQNNLNIKRSRNHHKNDINYYREEEENNEDEIQTVTAITQKYSRTKIAEFFRALLSKISHRGLIQVLEQIAKQKDISRDFQISLSYFHKLFDKCPGFPTLQEAGFFLQYLALILGERIDMICSEAESIAIRINSGEEKKTEEEDNKSLKKQKGRSKRDQKIFLNDPAVLHETDMEIRPLKKSKDSRKCKIKEKVISTNLITDKFYVNNWGNYSEWRLAEKKKNKCPLPYSINKNSLCLHSSMWRKSRIEDLDYAGDADSKRKYMIFTNHEDCRQGILQQDINFEDFFKVKDFIETEIEEEEGDKMSNNQEIPKENSCEKRQRREWPPLCKLVHNTETNEDVFVNFDDSSQDYIRNYIRLEKTVLDNEEFNNSNNVQSNHNIVNENENCEDMETSNCNDNNDESDKVTGCPPKGTDVNGNPQGENEVNTGAIETSQPTNPPSKNSTGDEDIIIRLSDDEGVYVNSMDDIDKQMFNPVVELVDILKPIRNEISGNVNNFTVKVAPSIQGLYEEIRNKSPSGLPLIKHDMFRVSARNLEKRGLLKFSTKHDIKAKGKKRKNVRDAEKSRKFKVPKLTANGEPILNSPRSESPDFLGFPPSPIPVRTFSQDSGIGIGTTDLTSSACDSPETESSSKLEELINELKKRKSTDLLDVSQNTPDSSLKEGIISSSEINDSGKDKDLFSCSDLQSSGYQSGNSILSSSASSGYHSLDSTQQIEDDISRRQDIAAEILGDLSKSTDLDILGADSDTSFEENQEISDTIQKVQKWHQSLRTVLAKSRERHHFDIFALGTEILSKFPPDENRNVIPSKSKSNITLEKVMEDKDPSFISRYFLCTLLLANQGNIEINVDNKKDTEPTSLDKVQMKLLSRKRHTVSLEDNIGLIPETIDKNVPSSSGNQTNQDTQKKVNSSESSRKHHTVKPEDNSKSKILNKNGPSNNSNACSSGAQKRSHSPEPELEITSKGTQSNISKKHLKRLSIVVEKETPLESSSSSSSASPSISAFSTSSTMMASSTPAAGTSKNHRKELEVILRKYCTTVKRKDHEPDTEENSTVVKSVTVNKKSRFRKNSPSTETNEYSKSNDGEQILVTGSSSSGKRSPAASKRAGTSTFLINNCDSSFSSFKSSSTSEILNSVS